MYWIAKPLYLPLHFSPCVKQYIFQTTRTKLAASVAHWRLLTSPIVEKNMCIFLVVVVAVDIVEDDDDDDVDDVDDEEGGRRTALTKI